MFFTCLKNIQGWLKDCTGRQGAHLLKRSQPSNLSFVTFLLVQKSNQKRQPAMKQPIAGTDFQLSLGATVMKSIGAFMS